MAVDDDVLADVLERLQPVGEVTGRKMFGGAGFWESGHMFALLDSSSTLHFKVDAATRPRYEAAGCSPFTPEMPGRRPTEMPYFTVPADVLADDARFLEWAREAVAVGHATAKKGR